ncbi:MAG: hypothetical protein IJD32_07795 [Bacteroidaceae bacterium]|nr:hypothetical protein [Bacteroidaceae bacterium]MBQ4056982.1 hypothetical protein [Bacteroidaceae bacterium]
MALKNPTVQVVICIIVCALNIMLMALAIREKEWVLAVLALASFISNILLIEIFRKKNKQ